VASSGVRRASSRRSRSRPRPPAGHRDCALFPASFGYHSASPGRRCAMPPSRIPRRGTRRARSSTSMGTRNGHDQREGESVRSEPLFFLLAFASAVARAVPPRRWRPATSLSSAALHVEQLEGDVADGPWASCSAGAHGPRHRTSACPSPGRRDGRSCPRRYCKAFDVVSDPRFRFGPPQTATAPQVATLGDGQAGGGRPRGPARGDPR
jgi:hypothetical protein